IINGDLTPERIENISPDIKLKLVASHGALAGTNLMKDETDDRSMPHFRGMTIREVLRIGREKGIEVKIVGSGWAVHQDPSAGATLGDTPRCQVSFSPGK
ncbi:MAG: PASTA domain-containing protein, partial [Smithellaceae bacterium]|nr:PASTA domain-containing protein [Smithellaceae bacterium]